MPPIDVAAGRCGPHSPGPHGSGRKASTPAGQPSVASPGDVRLWDRLLSVCGAAGADSERLFVSDATVHWPRTITGRQRRDRRIWYKDHRRQLINKWAQSLDHFITFYRLHVKPTTAYPDCQRAIVKSHIATDVNQLQIANCINIQYISKCNYIIVRLKASWTGLICRIHQYYHRQWLSNNEWSKFQAGPYVGFYFGGGLKIRGGERRGPKGRSPRSERPTAEVGFWGRVQPAPSPPARGLGECCKLPQRGPGRSPGRSSGLLHFVDSRWLFLAEATYYGACNFYTVKIFLVIIPGEGFEHVNPHEIRPWFQEISPRKGWLAIERKRHDRCQQPVQDQSMTGEELGDDDAPDW